MKRLTYLCLSIAVLSLGLSSATANADELLAWWSFNNSSSSDQGDGWFATGGSGYYFPMILNDTYDDGVWTGPSDNYIQGHRGDIMLPSYDNYYANAGALVPDAADDYIGDSLADTKNFLDTYYSQFQAKMDVSDLYGTNQGESSSPSSTWQSLGGTTANMPHGSYAGGALSLIGDVNNGSSFVIEADFTDWSDIEISWAQRGTSTGFNYREVEVSSNGTDWTSVWTQSSALTSTWATITLGDGSALNDILTSQLDNASTAFIRWTVDGATSINGNNRFDNLQMRGTYAPVPEPSTVAMLLGGLGLLGLFRRLRRAK